MNNKKIFITGGSRGIGRAIADQCARDGHDIIIVSRDKDNIDQAVSEIKRKYSVNAVGYCADVSDHAAMMNIISNIRKINLLPDVLVLNAGIFIEGDLLTAPNEDFARTLEVNFLSSFHIIRLLKDHLESKPSKIIVIASTAAHEAYPVGSLYGVAKWALRGLCVNLRKEFAEKSVSVHMISPGGTLTDLWDGEVLPPDRLLEPNDIGILASAIIRLSDQAVVEQLIVRPILGDMHE